MYRMPASIFRRAASRVRDPSPTHSRPRTPEPLSLKKLAEKYPTYLCRCREVQGGTGGQDGGGGCAADGGGGRAARPPRGRAAVPRERPGRGAATGLPATPPLAGPACLGTRADPGGPPGRGGPSGRRAGALRAAPLSGRRRGGGGGQVECPPLCSCTVRVRRQQTSGHG